jgi:uncharacterized repeat protein (TIGR03803 family)
MTRLLAAKGVLAAALFACLMPSVVTAQDVVNSPNVVSGTTSTFQVIHAFTGGGDGGWPYAGLTIDKFGNLYGTTYAYGSKHKGIVYQLTPNGSDWIFNLLYTFTGGSDGGGPEARVIIGPNGSLYGTTTNGGNGYGTVFQLSPPPTICKTAYCPWRERVLYAFHGAPDCGNGSGPTSFGDLIFDQAGNIYGTTYHGGVNNVGCVYKLMPSGSGGYTESVIHSFAGGSDGRFPFTGVILDSAGNLYGTTGQGGPRDFGTVYQLVSSSEGYTENILYSFTNGSDGRYAFGGLIFDRSGNLYGSTEDGGAGGAGTAFELTPVGNGNWSYSALYPFSGARYYNGPYASFVMDGAGNLYGTTWGSGAHGLGNVFKLTPTSQAPWTYTSLHDFTGYDGQNPISNVTFDASGNLYGTASLGDNGTCDTGCGVVWKITP